MPSTAPTNGWSAHSVACHAACHVVSTFNPLIEMAWPPCLALLEGCQLAFHVDIVSLTVKGILQRFLMRLPYLEQQRSVCGEAVNERLKNLAVSIQHQVGGCKAAPVRLTVGQLQPATSAFLSASCSFTGHMACKGTASTLYCAEEP